MKDMKHRLNGVKKNKLIIFASIFTIACISLLSVGYAANSSSLAFDGSAFARAEGDVRITDVQCVKPNTSSDTQGDTSGNIFYPEFTKDAINGGLRLNSVTTSMVCNIEVTNLSSYNVLITNIEKIRFTNTNMTYSFENVVVNDTLIPAANKSVLQLKIAFRSNVLSQIAGAIETFIENVLGINLNVYFGFRFSFYKVPQYTLSVTATPEDALIVFEVGDKVVASGTGHVSKLMDSHKPIKYTVSKKNYYTQSETITMTENTTRTIELVHKTGYELTINPTPSNSLVTFKVNGEVVSSGTGVQSYTAIDETTIEYTVSMFEYYDKTGSFTLAGKDTTIDVSLDLMPWITGTFTNTDRKVATTKEDVVYHPGKYLIEMWGGKGGQYFRVESKQAGYRGEAGYIYAIVDLEYNDKIFFTLGGNGRDGDYSGVARGGENGGGNGAATYAGGGGGYSAFAVGTTTINEANINSGNVLMIVAGGGGAGGSSLVAGKPGDGGNAGTLTSATTTISIGTVFHGADGTLNGAKEGSNGLGGTTTSKANSKGGKAGGLLLGGAGTGNGGGGGAGYYGGSGSGGAGTLATNQPGGAGGGSSFISSKVTYSNLPSTATSKLVATNPSSTGGAIVITYLGKN